MKRCYEKLLIAAAILSLASAKSLALTFNTDGLSTNINYSTNDFRLKVGVDEHNNSVIIDNGGNVLITELIEVGAASTNNLLSVQNGGRLVVGESDLSALATGGIVVGGTNDQAELFISEDSTVRTDYLYVGLSTNETGLVTLKDGGTLFVEETLNIGAVSNKNNRISIEEGGILSVAETTSIAINTNNNNRIVVKEAGALHVRGDVNADAFIERDNLTFNSKAILGVGGTLTTDNGIIDTSLNILLDDDLSTENTAQWNADTISIGDKGSYNSLTLTNGAIATATGITYIGDKHTSAQNKLIIQGDGSRFTTTDKLLIGMRGDDNSMIIGNGGSAIIGLDLKIGSSSDARNNALLVENSGSSLIVSNELVIGANGKNNSMTVSDGAFVNAVTDLTLGENGSAHKLTLNSNDTELVVAGAFTVGADGSNNKLTINDATARFLQGAVIGLRGNENRAEISGSNALFYASDLTLGADSDHNTFTNKGGTVVIANNLIVGEEGRENKLTINGSKAFVAVTNMLTVGSSSASNNAINVSNGGTLYVAGQPNIDIATNNSMTIANDGALKTTDWDFATEVSNLNFGSGAILHLLGSATGTNELEGAFNLLLDGPGANWMLSTNMYVGKNTGNNSLTLTNGANAFTSTNLYIGFNSANNTVTVSGEGSMLQVNNDLFIGNEDKWDWNPNAFANNRMELLNGASALVGGNVKLANAATLRIDASSSATINGDYEQLAGTKLELGISAEATTNLIVEGSTELDGESTISIYDDGIEEDTDIAKALIHTDTLSIDGQAATEALLGKMILTNSLLDFDIWYSADDQILYAENFISLSITEAGDLSGQLAEIGDEIAQLADEDNSIAKAFEKAQGGIARADIAESMANLYGEEASSAPAHNMINLGLQNVAEKLTFRADTTRERLAKRKAAPEGAAGPHTADQALQGWVAGFSSSLNYDEDGGFFGYDGSLRGYMVGGDFSVADTLLMGVAGGSTSGDVDKDNGASTRTKTSFVSLYGSLGCDNWYLDANLIYGRSNIDVELGETFDTTADYDADNYALYLNGGHEFVGKYLIFTPQIALLANYYTQEEYSEESSEALARSVDSADALYLQSTLGGSLALYMALGDTIIKPELRIHWQHEFNTDSEELPFTLPGGNGNYLMQLQAPEEDILKIGAGCSTKFGEGLELRADVDVRNGGGFSDCTVHGAIRYQF